jgi:heat shock protein HslJ
LRKKFIFLFAFIKLYWYCSVRKERIMHPKSPESARRRPNSVLFILLATTLIAIELCAFPGCRSQKTLSPTPEKAAAPAPAPQAAIIGSWELSGEKTVKPITLTVTATGEIYGSGGVNNYNGSLRNSFKSGKFVINGTFVATMKYAHGIQRETLFFHQLNQVDSWVVNNERVLELRKDGQVILRFTPAR